MHKRPFQHSELQTQLSWKTLGNSTFVAGYAAPEFRQGEGECGSDEAIAKAVSKVLRDPLLLRQLSEKVYELMLKDIRNQRERSRNYGSLF